MKAILPGVNIYLCLSVDIFGQDPVMKLHRCLAEIKMKAGCGLLTWHGHSVFVSWLCVMHKQTNQTHLHKSAQTILYLCSQSSCTGASLRSTWVVIIEVYLIYFFSLDMLYTVLSSFFWDNNFFLLMIVRSIQTNEGVVVQHSPKACWQLDVASTK